MSPPFPFGTSDWYRLRSVPFPFGTLTRYRLRSVSVWCSYSVPSPFRFRVVSRRRLSAASVPFSVQLRVSIGIG